MTTVRTTFRAALVTGAVASVAVASTAPAHAGTPSPQAATTAATSSRLAGADRFGTAVAISRHQFPNGARSVYLVSSTAVADAITAGMVDDGPILPVPSAGGIPASVRTEIARLAPSTVVAVGGQAVVPSSALADAGAGRTTKRLAGSDRYATAAAVARYAYGAPMPSNDHSTLFVNAFGGADGVVAGSIAKPSTPVLPLPATGPAPAVIRSAAAAVNGGWAYAVGGRAVLSDATFAAATPGQVRGRLAGADRYETSVKVAELGFGIPSRTVYLARSDVFTDALAAGTLTRGPVLLVPKDGVLPQSIARYLDATRPTQVIALGGTGAVSDRMLVAARNASVGRMPTVDVVLHNPYVAKDKLAPGWWVTNDGPEMETVSYCNEPSPSATVPNTYYCSPSAAYAISCYRKPGYTDVVTCIADPWKRTLLEYRTDKPLGSTPEPAAATPLGAQMASGNRCLIRDGGAWSSRGDLNGWAWCETDDLWGSDGQGNPLQRVDGSTLQYVLGPADVTKPAPWTDVSTRFFLG